MVQQQQAPKTEQQQIEELAKTMEFEDTTQPEFRADAAPAVTQTPPPAPSSDLPAPEEKPAVVPPETKPPEKPEAKKVDLSQIPEWREAQSKYDRRLADAEARLRAAEERATHREQTAAVEAATEATLRAQEQQLAQTLGDEAQAKGHVRSQHNVTLVRQFHAQDMALKAAQQRDMQQQALLNHAGKVVAVDQFAAAHHVPAEDKDLLMTASTPEDMERLAKRLGARAQQQAADTAKAKGRVPAETAATRLEDGSNAAPPATNFWDLLAGAETKHYADMTPEERKAVDRAFRGDIPAR